MIGEEITKYSKDKSWLLGNVIQKQLQGSKFYNSCTKDYPAAIGVVS